MTTIDPLRQQAQTPPVLAHAVQAFDARHGLVPGEPGDTGHLGHLRDRRRPFGHAQQVAEVEVEMRALPFAGIDGDAMHIDVKGTPLALVPGIPCCGDARLLEHLAHGRSGRRFPCVDMPPWLQPALQETMLNQEDGFPVGHNTTRHHVAVGIAPGRPVTGRREEPFQFGESLATFRKPTDVTRKLGGNRGVQGRHTGTERKGTTVRCNPERNASPS